MEQSNGVDISTALYEGEKICSWAVSDLLNTISQLLFPLLYVVTNVIFNMTVTTLVERVQQKKRDA